MPRQILHGRIEKKLPYVLVQGGQLPFYTTDQNRFLTGPKKPLTNETLFSQL
jgi:hypothetical protein